VKLAHFFQTIAPYLEGRAGFEETSRALFGKSPLPDTPRLAIYERFCRAHRQTATAGVHQYVRDLVVAQAGRERWDALVEAYFVAHPMRHVEINANGAQLAAFLAARPDVPPLWSALADFEWWEWQTLSAKDDPADATPDEGPLRLASTVELRPYGWDFVTWLDAEQRAPAPEEREVLVLFWRNRQLDARRELASVAELQVLKAVSEGGRVERDETFDDLHRAGVILGAR
jgi:hypothetical protein